MAQDLLTTYKLGKWKTSGVIIKTHTIVKKMKMNQQHEYCPIGF